MLKSGVVEEDGDVKSLVLVLVVDSGERILAAV